MLESLSYHHAFAHLHSESFQILVQGEFVEGHGLYEQTAGGVRQADQIEISLQDAVLAGSSVYGYIGKVRADLLARFDKGEVVTVYGSRSAVGQTGFPLQPLHLDDVNLEFLFVQEREDTFCAAQRYIVFGRVASGHDRDSLFHFYLSLMS